MKRRSGKDWDSVKHSYAHHRESVKRWLPRLSQYEVLASFRERMMSIKPLLYERQLMLVASCRSYSQICQAVLRRKQDDNRNEGIRTAF